MKRMNIKLYPFNKFSDGSPKFPITAKPNIKETTTLAWIGMPGIPKKGAESKKDPILKVERRKRGSIPIITDKFTPGKEFDNEFPDSKSSIS